MIRKTFISCLIVIGCVAFMMGAASIWLQTESGIAFATKHAERFLNRGGKYTVEIERLRLTLPLKCNIRSVTIREGDRVIAEAASLRIDIAALPLLYKRLDVARFKAAEVLLNLPEMEGKQKEWSWPDLPWSFIIHKIAIDQLEARGQTLALAGKGQLTHTLSADLTLDFETPDVGRYRIRVDGERKGEEIHAHITKETPAKTGAGAILAAGGILIESFEVTCFGRIDSWGAVITGKGGTTDQQLIGDFNVLVATSAATDPIAAKLVGETAQLEAVFTIDGTRMLHLRPLRGHGAGISIEGTLTANLDGRIQEGELRLTLPNLSLLDGLVGLTYSGELEGKLRLAGTFTAPTLDVALSGDRLNIQNRAIEGLTGRCSWQAGSGQLSLDATVATLPLTLTTSLNHTGELWTLSDITLKGPSSSVQGSLALTEEGVSTFNLEGEIEELWAWAPLIQLDVEGGVEFSIDYAHEILMGSLRAFTFNFQKLALEDTRIEINLTKPFTDPEGDLTATAERASYNRVAAVDVNFNTTLGGASWPFSLEWEGEDEVSGFAHGEWSSTKKRFWSRWEAFGGMILDEEVRLLEPVTVEKLQGEEVTFTPLRLSAGGGLFYLSYDPETIKLEMSQFPLQAAELLLPGLGLVGVADANIELTGLQKSGEGTIAFSVRGVELKESPVTDLGSVYGSFHATIKEGRLDGILTADSTRSSPLKANVQLPIHLTATPFTCDFPDDGSLGGWGTFTGELAPLIQFFLPYNMTFLGDVNARVTLSGTAGNPDLKGDMTLTSGLFEDAYSGAQLSHINALFEIDGARVTLVSMSAQAGEGSVTATGTLTIDPDKNYPLQLDGKLENARLASLSVAQMNVSGDLTLSGPFLTPTFSGHLVTDSGRITLPKRFSTTGFPNLEVTYINLPPSKRGIIEKTQPVKIGLALTLDVPNNLTVRGRGLRATLGGKIEISGTIGRPSLAGDLALTRGEFTFGSKNFTLTEGNIAFNGPPADHTRIDVSGSIRITDVEVGATISGILPNVKLSLFSNPPMTDREILSYLLFDSPASLIGAGQALQLAAAGTEVAGGNFGPGLLSSLPKTIGLDGLTVSSPAGNSEELGIQATKRITPNFDVNIYKSINSASNHLIIEFNFFREFSFRAERVEETDDEPGADRLSLRWRHDY